MILKNLSDFLLVPKTLGVVYTMDHQVVPRPCKVCDWLLNSPRDHFGLHRGKKMSEGSWSSRSPKDIFWGLHYPLTWSNGFCYVRGKRGPLVEKGTEPMVKKPCYRFFGGKEDEDKSREMNGRTWIFFSSQNCFFLIYFQQFTTFTYWCMVIPLYPHSVYT